MEQQQGMFGPNPLDVQDSLDSQFIKNNSSLDLGSMSARAGLALGNGINGLLGREDPRVAQAKMMQQVKEELRQEGLGSGDPDTFYPALIKKLNSKGLVEQAMQVAQTYESQKLAKSKTQSEITKNNAAAYASMREKLSPIGKLQAEYADAVARGDDKRAKELQDAIGLANQGNLEKTTEGVPGKEDWVRDVLRSRDGKLVHEGEPYKKNPPVNIDQRATSKFYETTGIEAKKQWDTAQKGFQIAIPTMKTLEELLNGPLITGTLADKRNEALRVARLFGIASKDAEGLIDNNDILQSLAINIVLPKMKQLGGSDSNEELQKLLAAGPNAKISPEAMKRMIKLFYQDARNHAEIASKVRQKIKAGDAPEKAWSEALEGVGVDMSSPLAQETPTAPSKPSVAPVAPKPSVNPQTAPQAAKDQYRAFAYAKGKAKGMTDAEIEATIKKYLKE